MRGRRWHCVTRVLGLMTAGSAFGQLVGPLVPRLLALLPGIGLENGDHALRAAMALTAVGLAGCALYLWREARRSQR